jgi:hypothetical protein
MKKPPLEKTLRAFQNVALAVFAGLLLLQAFNTLDWRMEHDTPLLHYAAFLMDKHDAIPYRDIFETSMPGAFAFHYCIGKSFGYGDVQFRYVDLLVLGTLLAATYVFTSRFGRLAAIWGVVIFGLVYFSKGQSMSLQRDYIGIVPVAFTLLLIPAKRSRPVGFLRFAIVGVLFGMSVLIKPHLGIALPAVFGTLLAHRWGLRSKSFLDLLKCGAVCGASFLVPVLTAVFWLASKSALVPFAGILLDYLPLHTAMTGGLRNVGGIEHAAYLIDSTLRFGNYGPLLLCSLFAYYRVSTLADQDKTLMKSFILLVLCTMLYSIYPTLAGKFWSYHYMPFAYFCSISAGLCLFAWPEMRANSTLVCRLRKALPGLILIIAVTLQLDLPTYALSSYHDLRSGPEAHLPKGGRVDEIAAWLKTRLQPGDTVQPLDWTGGSIHAMLLAEAQLATRFMYDYHFYHHVSLSFVQELRQSFIDQLRKASPRFIIEVHTRKPSGIDSKGSFPALHNLLDAHYTVAFEGNGYLIYERATDTEPRNAQQLNSPDED